MFFKYSKIKRFFLEMKQLSDVVAFNEWNGENSIILRHDIDYDLESAYNLAKIEYECGVNSTFFIMTSHFTYNPMNKKNRYLLNEISKMGFEIGLHFDPTIYNKETNEELEKCVNFESTILTSIIDKKIHSVSLHNPSLHGEYPWFDNYINAYNKKVFNNENYISDSCMNFRGKDPYKFIHKVKSMPIQVLLHPIHFTKEGIEYPEICSNFCKKYINTLDKVNQGNYTYAEMMKNTTLLKYIALN